MPFSFRLPVLIAFLASAAAPEEYRRLSLTVDPVWLIADTRQVTLEARPVEHWSGAVVLGHGTGNSYFMQSASWQAGAQARWYPGEAARVERHFVAELKGGQARSPERSPADVSTLLSFALGGGYKFTSNAGLTLEAVVGAMAYRTDYRIEETDQGWTPYVDFAIGWSFFPRRAP